jgi:glycosyltransferase involved in cell wall biosynthesis
MNILAFENCPTTAFGGSERSYFDVLTGLQSKGHQVFLFYRQEGNLVEKYEAAGVKTKMVPIPYMLRRGRKIKDLLLIIRAVAAGRFNRKNSVIYLNYVEAIPMVALLKLIFRYPIVCHLRVGFGGLTRQIVYSGRLVDSYIVVNKNFKLTFEEVFRKEGINVIYNGIRIPAVLPSLKKRASNEKLKILVLGRIAPEKGVLELVSILPQLVSAGVNFSLQITGDYIASHSGDFAKELKELIDSLDINYLVTISPPIDEPVSYIADFDLFVFPAIWEEPFGRTVPEAILAGTPVLARGVGMIGGIMSDNQHFVFDTNEALAGKIIQFYKGALIFDFVHARQRVIQEFNKDRMIGEVEEVLLKYDKK